MNATPGGIVRVAKLHVEMYEKRVQKGKEGHRFVNLPECERYLALWTSIVRKEGKNLSKEEMSEVEDAWNEGSYAEAFAEA